MAEMRVARLLLAGWSLGAAAGCVALGLRAAAYHPRLDPARFQARVDNPYYPLAPGTTYEYEERSQGETSANEIVVTRDTRTILGVLCTVVRDVVIQDGELSEETSDCIAQDRDGNV